MQLLESPHEMRQLAEAWRCEKLDIGFVPTMGALHDGHLALVRRAREENKRVVASIFVNPTQFAPHEDLAKYPRPFERDCELLAELGCDAIFAPTSATMYPSGADTIVEVMRLGERWEGAVRPGHLRGVATVVAKLFNVVAPTGAYFGEKDFQQVRVIEQMSRDLNFAIEIVPCPTVRQADGLALSSRNAYLSPDEKRAASALFRALTRGAQSAQNGERDVVALVQEMQSVLETEPQVMMQYLAVVDAHSLQPLLQIGADTARILIAAHVGATRLIDNMAI